jgi:hypothetical protein
MAGPDDPEPGCHAMEGNRESIEAEATYRRQLQRKRPTPQVGRGPDRLLSG